MNHPGANAETKQKVRSEENAVKPLVSMLNVREDTAEPIYQQLARQIEKLIADGLIEAGSTLPAERHLAENLGVSRTTIQHCYNMLRERGVLTSKGRLGSIVMRAPRLDPGMDRLKGFTEEMRELGRTASSTVLENEIVVDPAIAAIFGMPSESRFLKLVRVRYGDGVPLSYERAWYNLGAAPGLHLQDASASMYQSLAELGMPLLHCEQSIEAAVPSAEACRIFDYSEPLPCLLIKRRSYSANDRMVEYVEGLFRGDAYTYRLKLKI